MGGLKDLFVEDVWIKAFSLVFAIFLWMSIVGGESAEEFFVVPLSIKNVPDNMIISNDVVDYVNVRVRGQRGILKSLNIKQIHVGLDLKDVQEGENTVTLFPEEVKLPEGVTAVRVSPSLFTIQLSRLTEKWLPVIPAFMGAPASRFKVGKVVTTPAKIAVTGLEAALKDQVHLETKHVELFGKDHSFSAEVALKPLSGNVYIKGPQKVKVDVEILENISKREIQDIPVTIQDGRVAHPDRVALVLSGPESGLTELLPTSIQVVIPPQEEEGTLDVEPQVTVPEGFVVLEIQPKVIQVKVKKE